MQLKNFKIFISDIFKEAARLQKHDVAGRLLTKSKYSDAQKISFVVSLLGVYLLKKGFSDNFAGYTISFLGIFIGLFTTIIISLYEKKEVMLGDYSSKDQFDKNRLIKIKNYLLQFTAFVSYSIVVGLFVITLLFLVLLLEQTHIDFQKWQFVKSFDEINFRTTWMFTKGLILSVHRFLICYLLCMFFATTLFSVSSYFSFLLSEYKRIKFKDHNTIE